MSSSASRREFLRSIAGAAAAASAVAAARKTAAAGKRDAVLAMLDKSGRQPYIPAAFFIHFDPAYHFGEAAVKKHLEYFRATGMDFVKIQYREDLSAGSRHQAAGGLGGDAVVSARVL